MTTPDKCEAILREIINRVNADERIFVAFSKDCGGNSCTLEITQSGHTHCGINEEPWSFLVDSIHAALTGGPGLSFAGGGR